jgi:Holliday junction resolvase RusA-like endonuclease
VTVRILLIKPDRRRRDVDNYGKSILDALVLSGVIEDDSLIEKLMLAWYSKDLSGCFVEIRGWNDSGKR